MLEERFEVKTEVVGAKRKEGEEPEGRILGRVMRITAEEWEYEADPRHAEMIIEAAGLGEANAVGSPGEDEKRWQEEENGKELEEKDVSRHRGTAA
eukprot:11052795-Karenia_brevis.AAC.1